MPPKKRTMTFNEAHVITYGLQISERAPTTKEVISVSCQFCIFFGREEKVGAKRKATSNIQYFRCPFCADVYTRHMLSQHHVVWERYCALSNEEKATFFNQNAPVAHRNTLRSHFEGAQEHMHYFVSKDIVDVIIADMFFEPDDATISKERVLAIFDDVIVPEETAHDSDLRTDRYRIVIKNPIQFRLIIGYISGGASFRMACRFLLLTKRR